MWTDHYKTFLSLGDFEAAFIQNIMGNFLSFIDIYNRTLIAAEGGDFRTVVYQVSRLVRRLLDFNSMMREGAPTLVKDVIRLGAYLNFYANLGDNEALKSYPAYEHLLSQEAGLNWSEPNDVASALISIVTGFFDGSFRATNTSLCRSSLKKLTGSFGNMSLALYERDQNQSVWYTTRVLKFMHPSGFHCYYAGKETYTSFSKYLSTTSWKDILYNVVYKTGLMMDQSRIIAKLAMKNDTLSDREVYVVARSVGSFINIVLQTDSARPYYPPLWQL